MRRWPGFKCRGLKIFERDLIARAASSLAMPNLAKTFLRVSPDAIVCCASIGGVNGVLGSFSSSSGSPQEVIGGDSPLKKGLLCHPTPGSAFETFKSAADRCPDAPTKRPRHKPVKSLTGPRFARMSAQSRPF